MGNPYDFVVDGALMLCEGSKHATFICKDRGLLIGNKPVGLQSDCSVNNFSKQYFGICKMTGRQCAPNFIGEWINTVEEDKVVDGKKLNDSMNSLRDSCLKAMIALKKYVDICHADFEDKNNDGVIDNIIYWFAHGFKTEEDNWNEIQANDDLKKWVNQTFQI